MRPSSRCRPPSPAPYIAAPSASEPFAQGWPDIVFHLAAVVSGEAEADFEKGYSVNLDGTRALFDAIRAEAAKSPFVAERKAARA